MAKSKQSLLFVCMGNICRSPLAEGVFRHQANQRGVMGQFRIDSAGTGGWHAGELPDHRMRAVAERHGVKLTSLARQVTKSDLSTYERLICMDESNRENLRRIGAPGDRLHLLLDFHPDARQREVPDPYYGGADGFEHVYGLVDAACSGLLDHLLAERA